VATLLWIGFVSTLGCDTYQNLHGECARDSQLTLRLSITDMSAVMLHEPQNIRNDDRLIAYDGYLLLFSLRLSF